MKRFTIPGLFLAITFVAAGYFFSTPQRAQEPISFRDAQFEKFISRASSEGPLRVIVGLRSDFVPVGDLSRGDAVKQGSRIKSAQGEFLNRYFPARAADDAILFDSIPFVVVFADAAVLEQMKADGQVTSIEEDVADAPGLAESTGVVNAPSAWSNGYTGSGWAVAVIDSGVMKTHDFLAGRVVSEACYSQTVSGSSTTVCPGGVSQSTDTDSGVNCDPAVNGCAHGTHVAGIVAGNGPTSSGVAKGSSIVAIQAFSRFDNATSCGSTPVPCALSYVSDQVRGLERVLALSSTMNIASVNMSLGGGQNTTYCDTAQASRKAAIDNLRSVNIATIIASGNNGYTNAIGAPACISTAFSVGSTGDGSSGATLNEVVSSSNSASMLNFLAPGRWILSSVAVTGGATNAFSNYNGTSMATPHVAGAWAIMRQRKPSASVAEIANALSATGLAVNDTRNSIVKPRINVGNAVNLLNCTSPITLGQTVTGTLATSDCYVQPDATRYADTYVFSAVANQQVTIAMNAAGFDAYLFLVDSNNQILAQDNNGGGGTNARVPATGTFTLPANGTYSIIATSSPNGGLGNYNVTLSANCDYALGSSSASLPAAGGAGTITFSANTNAGCNWTAISNDAWISITSGGSGTGNATVNYSVAANTGEARTGTITVGGLTFTVNQAAGTLQAATLFDYDGDGRADLSVRRASDNVWHLLRATAGYTAMQWGVAGDRMAPADYDGDRKTDVAVFRPSEGRWYVYMSQSQTFQTFNWGVDGDLPVPADRDGDGSVDLVIFRPSNSTWYTRFANGTFETYPFGESGDKPVRGDFDGDGRSDIAVYRPSNNNWYFLKSTAGYFVQTWGEPGDIPATGDFDGDGKTDNAVFRPATGQWYLSQSSGGFVVQSWGESGDVPVAADYDGDGRADMAVFRPSNSTWYALASTTGMLIQQYGIPGDVPTQSAYNY